LLWARPHFLPRNSHPNGRIWNSQIVYS
jgi:hypothetical protein